MTEVIKYSKIGKEDLALKSSATDTSLAVTLPDGTEVVLTKISLDEFIAHAAVNFNLQQASSFLLEILTANPSTNTQGRIYLFDTTQDVLRYMDGSVVRELVDLAITQTLTNKTLTSPRIGTAILDTSGNEILGMIVTASAVNFVDVVPSATNQDVIIRAVGDDTDIDLDLQAKGTGVVRADGVEITSLPVGNRGDVLIYNGTVWTSLAFGTSSQILETRGSGADPQWAGMTTQGDVLYRDASGVARLAAGTSGQRLTTQGASANPIWETVVVADLIIESNNDTEGTTTSTSTADVVTLGSLSIAATRPVFVQCAIRKATATSSTCSVGMKVNGTAVIANFTCYNADVATGSGIFWAFLPSRVTNYQGGVGYSAMSGAGGIRADASAASVPIATITEIIITGQVGNGSATFGVDEVKVYSMDPS